MKCYIISEIKGNQIEKGKYGKKQISKYLFKMIKIYGDRRIAKVIILNRNQLIPQQEVKDEN